jgi:hypothetical protein
VENKSIPEMRARNSDLDFEEDSDMIPTNEIETVLNNYAKDVEEQEKFYKNKIEEEKQKTIDRKEELKAITDE